MTDWRGQGGVPVDHLAPEMGQEMPSKFSSTSLTPLAPCGSGAPRGRMHFQFTRIPQY